MIPPFTFLRPRLILAVAFTFIYNTSFSQLTGFTLTGNPQTLNGATWTYQDSVNGIYYDLEGILISPSTGSPPYPAVILSHGQGGRSTSGYPPGMGKKFVEWGFVAIAVNLCHASNVPVGSPGTNTFADFGASEANVLRNMKCWDILASLGYVDTNCIAASGNSHGSFTSLATVAAHTDKFSCANHTGGGISSNPSYAAPTDSQAALIQTPYIFHHGDSDQSYPIAMDSAFNDVLDSTGCIHAFHVYPGYTHGMVTMDSLTLARIHSWFTTHMCKTIITSSNEKGKQDHKIYPNPANEYININDSEEIYRLQFYNINGMELFRTTDIHGRFNIDVSAFPDGLYILQMQNASGNYSEKISIMH